MEKTLFFLDFENINISARRYGNNFDYTSLLGYIGDGRFLVDSFAYLPINPRNEIGSRRIEERLWDSGYHVVTKLGTIAGEGMKCNVDIEMAIDILRAAYNCRPDIVVLGSGDADFIPVIGELRKMGIRAEVAAFPDAASRALTQRCSGFINLDIFMTEKTDPDETEGHIEEDIEEQSGVSMSSDFSENDTNPTENIVNEHNQVPALPDKHKPQTNLPFANFFS